MYGFTNSQELATDAQGGKFGKNTGALVTKFEFNPNGGLDGAAQECIDFTVEIEGREFRRRYFPVTKVFSPENGELTDPNSQEYKEEMKKAVNNLNAALSDIVSCFVDIEVIKENLSTPISSFKEFAQILERLVKSNPNWDKTPVDIFLQYQWSPRGNQDRTYLEIPSERAVKHGAWICKSLGDSYVKIEGASLKYKNAEGEEHPFKRSEWFMTSNFANLQTLTSDTNLGQSSTPTVDW